MCSAASAAVRSNADSTAVSRSETSGAVPSHLRLRVPACEVGIIPRFLLGEQVQSCRERAQHRLGLRADAQ